MVPLNLSLDWQATELLWDLKRHSLFSLRRKGFSLNHTHNVGFKKSDDPQQTRRNEGKLFFNQLSLYFGHFGGRFTTKLTFETVK